MCRSGYLRSFPTRRSSDLVAKLRTHDGDAYSQPVTTWVDVGEPDLWVRSGTSLFRIDTETDRKSTRLNSSHVESSYAVFCLKKKNTNPARLHRGEIATTQP